ncbi:MAG: glycosyltransferase [Cyclobacteriaceae bacterium]
MTLYFTTIFAIYLLFLVLTYIAWRAIPGRFHQQFQAHIYVTVIIPVRNESSNIQYLLKDLQEQKYPHQLMEVIVVNDNSSDGTEGKVQNMINQVDYHLRVFNLELPIAFSGSSKKLAISQAIAKAKGEIIVTTDGDCRVRDNWLLHLIYPIQENEAVFVAGPVAFTDEKNYFQKLQTIEFSSLIISGAVAISLHRPTMCNGANLAYRKDAFRRVNGYQGNEGIASGDDEFLLQKISKCFAATRIIFQKSKEAIVFTSAQPDWKSFFQQRRRWAGKWKKHGNPVIMALALFVFIFQISFIAAVLLVLIQSSLNPVILWLICTKILLEFILLKNALQFLNKKLNLLKFMVLQFLYPFYVVYFGIAANFGSFNWKGRTYKN